MSVPKTKRPKYKKKSGPYHPSNGYRDRILQDIPCETIMPRHDLAPHQYNIVSREGYNLKTDEILIMMQCRILKRNQAGQFAALPANEPVTTVNNFLYSAFRVSYIDLKIIKKCIKSKFRP